MVTRFASMTTASKLNQVASAARVRTLAARTTNPSY
jgi:hypothetical protein